MKILYVHERYGSLAGAEANAFITATEIGRLGHTMGILHGPSTGKNEAGWLRLMRARMVMGQTDKARQARDKALQIFRADNAAIARINAAADTLAIPR